MSICKFKKNTNGINCKGYGTYMETVLMWLWQNFFLKCGFSVLYYSIATTPKGLAREPTFFVPTNKVPGDIFNCPSFCY